MELLAARGLTKYFPETDTLANDRVSLSVGEGEIRAVVGENGAGKSTLARILAGIAEQDAGEILVRGQIRRFRSVREAERAGIGLVPQHSFLAEGMNLAEAIALGHEPRRAGFLLDRRRAYVDAALLAERFGFAVDPGARVGELSPAERREAELMRALARGGDVLILDEPTSLLTPSETEGLFSLLRRLAEAGKGILYISHRAAELRALARSLTVLRGGRVVADRLAAEVDDAELANLMANMESTAPGGDGACRIGDSARGKDSSGGNGGDNGGDNGDSARRSSQAQAFESRDLALGGSGRGGRISFAVKPGEILGFIGLAGNGLDALEAIAAGLARPSAGSFLFAGKPAGAWPRAEFRESLLSYVPSARDERGLSLEATVRDNILALERRAFGRRDWFGRSARDARSCELSSRLALQTVPETRAAALSGGNRQRLLLARELDPRRPLALLCDPTQGLDLAAQKAAVDHILELKAT
ncbi:MAG: ATP-binding cassette domain-containing protein, partial [Spirochaetaceae bacterium]|nr:ATP-binding cassette domain-containing protein [Spirochaetaceae bacterium]